MSTRKRLIIAATALAVVATTIALLLTTGSPARESPQAVPVIASGCPAGPETDTIPTAPPPDLQWRSIGAVPAPTSPKFGPSRYRGNLWTCFAHSPMGAVLAVYDIPASLLSPDWLAAAVQELGPGPGRDAFIRISDEQTYQQLTPGEIAKPVGFQIASYSPYVATIQLLADAGNGEYQEDARTVSWIDGDWKLAMMPDGTTGPDPEVVTSADGFVLWGGSHG